nr:hypothetical protein Iba_chr12cCG12260 [Ipomoea batatas]
MHGDCRVGNIRNIKRVGVSNLWQGISKAAFTLNAGVQLATVLCNDDLATDKLCWALNDTGCFTVSSAYEVVMLHADENRDRSCVMCSAENVTARGYIARVSCRILNIFSRNAPRLKSLASRMRGDVAGHWSVLFGVSD